MFDSCNPSFCDVFAYTVSSLCSSCVYFTHSVGPAYGPRRNANNTLNNKQYRLASIVVLPDRMRSYRYDRYYSNTADCGDSVS